MDLSRYHVTTDITRPIIEYLRASGQELSPLEQDTGGTVESFTAIDGRVPINQELRLWDWAAHAVKDDHFGLTLASTVNLRGLGVVGFLSLQQPTLISMLETFHHYRRLVHEVATLRPSRSRTEDCIEHFFSEEGIGPGRHANEFTLASVWRILSGIAETPLTLLGVDFQHAAPPSESRLLEVFGRDIRLRFSMPINKLFMPPGTFDTATNAPDLVLAGVLKAHADQALAELPKPEDYEGQIRELLPKLLIQGQASIDRVATMMGTSRRTLQRRLGQKGMIFRDIVELVRRELALQYIDNRGLNLSEIGFLLGFSELAAFSRAFRRWNGKSPRAFRYGSP